MEKPYVICCLASTVDGEILTGHYFEQQKKHGIAFKQFCEGCACHAYGADYLMLEGGDSINSLLLQEGSIDEVRILVLRLKNCGADTSSMFENSSAFVSIVTEKFKLTEVNTLENNMVWLKYQLRNGDLQKETV